jgi:anti-sigma factor RsiW
LLSALVDGELSGAELDRANAHVAACGACRVEAHALRRLKHELRALAEVDDGDDFTRRLLAIKGTGAYPGHDGGHQGQDGEPGRARPLRRAGRRRLPAGRRGRYVLWSTVSLVVVGVGTAAFGMGGNSGNTGPQITPQLEVFDMQHAITSGDVPFEDPTGVSSRVPVVAATP